MSSFEPNTAGHRDPTVCSSSPQKEYKKDHELGVKGKGMTEEDTPDLLRVKNAGQILNEVPFGAPAGLESVMPQFCVIV